MLFAAWRSANAMAFLPFGVLLLIIRPPLNLLLGTRRSQLANLLAEAKRLISFPILHNKQSAVEWLTPGIWKRSIFKWANARCLMLNEGEFLFTCLRIGFSAEVLSNVSACASGINSSMIV